MGARARCTCATRRVTGSAHERSLAPSVCAPPKPRSPTFARASLRAAPVINVAGFIQGHEDLINDNDYVHTT